MARGRLARRLVLAVWLGVLLSISVLVTPLLFLRLADRHLAGELAGQLFTAVFWMSGAFGVALTLGAWRHRDASTAAEHGRALVPVGLLAISEWLVRPALDTVRAAAGADSGSFRMLHAASTVLYAAATLAVLVLAVREFRR